MSRYFFIYIVNDDLDIFYKLLIASTVTAFALGFGWLALLGCGLLDNINPGANLVSTNVNQNYNYDTQRNYVRST